MNQKNLIAIVVVAIVLLISVFVFVSGQGNREVMPGTAQDEAGSTEAFTDLMQELSVNLEGWKDLSVVDKVRVVNAVMTLYTTQQNVKFTRPPEFYAASVDSAVTNESMRSLPLDRVLMILAVMEYDYDTGQDKDALAKEILGEAMYEQNKARLLARAQQAAQQ